MPLPIIPDVFQCTISWSNPAVPRPASTTLHFLDTVGTQTEQNLITDFDTNVTATMWNSMKSDTVATEIRVTKLDGVSAGVTNTITAAAKWSGVGTGNAIPQGAHVISIKSAQRGSRGRNRIYLPFVAEDRQDAGVITPATVAAMTTAWVTFSTAMGVSGWSLQAVSALHSDTNDVTTLIAKPFMATQRRRARR